MSKPREWWICEMFNASDVIVVKNPKGTLRMYEHLPAEANAIGSCTKIHHTIEHSAYQALLEQAEKLASALEYYTGGFSEPLNTEIAERALDAWQAFRKGLE